MDTKFSITNNHTVTVNDPEPCITYMLIYGGACCPLLRPVHFFESADFITHLYFGERAMLWNGEPFFNPEVVEEPCGLEEALVWSAGKANCQGECEAKTRTQWQ